MWKSSFILFFLIIYTHLANNIVLELFTNNENKYNYNLLKLGSPPDTLYSIENTNINGIIQFENEHEFPFTVALHVSDIDYKHDRMYIFELDSSYIKVSLDLLKNDFTTKGTQFQQDFNKMKDDVKSLEISLKNGNITPQDFNEKLSEIIIKTAEVNPNSPTVYFMIYKIINNINDNDIVRIIKLLNNSKLDNEQIKLLKNVINESLKNRILYSVGEGITSIDSISDNNLNNLKLDVSKGKHFIYVWATTCGPCIKKLDNYKNIVNKKKDLILTIISIDKDLKRWQKFIELKEYEYQSYIASNNHLIDKFNIGLLPFSLYIEDGIIKEINPELEKYFEN